MTDIRQLRQSNEKVNTAVTKLTSAVERNTEKLDNLEALGKRLETVTTKAEQQIAQPQVSHIIALHQTNRVEMGDTVGEFRIPLAGGGRKLLGLVSWEPLGWPKEWPDLKVEMVWDDGNVRVILRGDLRQVKRDFEELGIKVQLRLVVATSP